MRPFLTTFIGTPTRAGRIGARVVGFTAFVVAACLSYLAAFFAAGLVEARSFDSVREALRTAGQDWTDVETDGLLVRLSGEAPSEATRFRALTAAASVVDAERVMDLMSVASPLQIADPVFSLEVLRNDDGISLIGLVPAAMEREALIETLSALDPDRQIVDMMEQTAHPVPETWDRAIAFGVVALKLLPRSKISIAARRVAITAITDSPAEKARVEAELARRAPAGLRLVLDISAPRPVLTPFTLRFLIDAEGARFDACSADTERARAQIITAAVAAGLVGKADCTIGMGVPTPDWALAATMAIAATASLGAASLTMTDADIALIAADIVPQADFDRAVGELESNLPDVFSLHAVLTPPPPGVEALAALPEFTATLSPEGRVQLRGRLTDERAREAVESYARARFGIEEVYAATRLDGDLPRGWPVRVLAALEALAELNSGSVLVRADTLRITGVTGNTETGPLIARMLADRLGEAATFEMAVSYEAALDPALALPSPEECVTVVNGLLKAAKISFDPGSATITRSGAPVIGQIAEVMKDCAEVQMEVAGHTDSQGREEMNLTLSQQRAQAVVLALMDRRVLTGNLDAKGYGEARPIADNQTEAGREANRRIEFTLQADADAAAARDAEADAAADGEAAPEAGGPADGSAVAATEGETGASAPGLAETDAAETGPEGAGSESAGSEVAVSGEAAPGAAAGAVIGDGAGVEVTTAAPTVPTATDDTAPAATVEATEAATEPPAVAEAPAPAEAPAAEAPAVGTADTTAPAVTLSEGVAPEVEVAPELVPAEPQIDIVAQPASEAKVAPKPRPAGLKLPQEDN